MPVLPERIRNFVIIAHVDHGKSTLADRFLELTGTVEQRKMREQFLDQMDLERERGITIKMQPVRMRWRYEGAAGSGEYLLHLIDTPGHADFSYEVSRSLAAVEGAVLLVDASQGVQAQTVANVRLARQEHLIIIPVVNKIDLPGVAIAEVAVELERLAGCRPEDVLRVSAKTGAGVAGVLRAVIERVPPPCRSPRARAAVETSRALVFDSHFDSFRGIVAHVRVFNGCFRKGERFQALATGGSGELMEVGFFAPALKAAAELAAGEIGYLATGLKDLDAIRVGDTITKFQIPRLADRRANHKFQDVEPLPGYREPKPVVFANAYPEDADGYEKLRDALQKAKLNDAALTFEPERSEALGRGFRLGFLGMLHMEIVGERLQREYGVHPIFTAPSVAYRVAGADGHAEYVRSASRFPEASGAIRTEEPWVRLEIFTPQRFLGSVLTLLARTRGGEIAQEYLGAERLALTYEVPLKDILADFSNALKSATEGYGSFSYEPIGYRPGVLARVDVLVAGEREEALSVVVPQEHAYAEGKRLVERLKKVLPRQLFAVALQAAAGGRVIARETLPALGKNVTGHLYGGDRTRKMKLWKKQERGKKRLRARGRVAIPPGVFLEMLKR